MSARAAAGVLPHQRLALRLELHAPGLRLAQLLLRRLTLRRGLRHAPPALNGHHPLNASPRRGRAPPRAPGRRGVVAMVPGG
jgi:hypothetical protein